MFELFDLGRNLSKLPNQIKDIKNDQVHYPYDFPVYDSLRQLLATHNIIAQKIPGLLSCAGPVELSLFSHKAVGHCLASVDPDRKIVEVSFVATDYMFDGYPNYRVIEFLDRANTLLQIGCVNLSFIPDGGFGFEYTVRFGYDEKRTPGKMLLSNLVSNVTDAALFLPPAIEAFQKGVSPEDAIKHMFGKAKSPASPLASQRKKLFDLVIEALKESNIKYVVLPDEKGFQYSSEGDSEQYTISISRLDKITFLTKSNVEIPADKLRIVGRYAAILNKRSPVSQMSDLILDRAERRMLFRTSLDARTIEDKLDTMLISMLLRENVIGARVVFSALPGLLRGERIVDVVGDIVQHTILEDSIDSGLSTDDKVQQLRNQVVEKLVEGFVARLLGGGMQEDF